MEELRWMLLAVVCLLPVQLLRRRTPEMALLLILAVVTMIAGRFIILSVPLLKKFEGILVQAGMKPEYISALMKTVAAALVTRFCADLCRDGGSQAMAGATEFGGAVVVMLILLPLLEAVAEILVGIGGGL